MKRTAVIAAVAALAVLSEPLRAEPRGTITLYTSQPSNQLSSALADFAKAQPNVKVEVFRSGTTEILNKLQAEATAGTVKADVVLLADEVAMTHLKQDGRLLAYPDAPVAKLPATLVDPQRTFFGTRLITTGIVYNTKLVKTAPKSWTDLVAKEAASKTILPSPLYSGAAVLNVGTIVQQPSFGWAYYEGLARNGAISGRGNGAVIDAVARGEKAYGIIIDYMAMNAKAKGSPVDFVFPAEGVTVMSQPIAILKTTKNVDAAKAFVDWQLSDAAQRKAVAQGYYPALTGIAPPAGYPDLASVKLMSSDMKALVDQGEANKQKFSDLFGG